MPKKGGSGSRKSLRVEEKAAQEAEQGEMHWGWACMVVLVMMVCGQTLRVCSPKAAAFCGLVLVFGSKLVSCDAAGLPFGMVSEPRRRLEPTLAGSLVEYLAVKMYFRVSAEFLELCYEPLHH